MKYIFANEEYYFVKRNNQLQLADKSELLSLPKDAIAASAPVCRLQTGEPVEVLFLKEKPKSNQIHAMTRLVDLDRDAYLATMCLDLLVATSRAIGNWSKDMDVRPAQALHGLIVKIFTRGKEWKTTTESMEDDSSKISGAENVDSQNKSR